MKIADLAKKSMALGFKQTMAEEIANHEGKVNMAMIGAEAVSVLVLIVIFMIIPFIGNAITTAMSIPAKFIERGSAEGTHTSAGLPATGAEATHILNPAWTEWYEVANGVELWTTLAPILQTACIVVVVGLILKVIYDLRAGQKNDN